jgi:hypothetical protein
VSDPSLDERPNLPTAALGQIDRVCDRFEADWRVALMGLPPARRGATMRERSDSFV